MHISNLVCLQHFCSKCETVADIEQDCVHCGKRRHSFWDDCRGDMLSHLCQPSAWVKNIIMIANNAKACDLLFILLKWQVQLIMKGMKIMVMLVLHIVSLDCISFIPFALPK